MNQTVTNVNRIRHKKSPCFRFVLHSTLQTQNLSGNWKRSMRRKTWGSINNRVPVLGSPESVLTIFAITSVYVSVFTITEKRTKRKTSYFKLKRSGIVGESRGYYILGMFLLSDIFLLFMTRKCNYINKSLWCHSL